MNSLEENENLLEVFKVVSNHHEQYSILPSSIALPDGWKAVGVTGSQDFCLSYIEKNWIDLTPNNVKLHMS